MVESEQPLRLHSKVKARSQAEGVAENCQVLTAWCSELKEPATPLHLKI